MANWEDYYEILGVDPAASTKEIRTAWRRIALDLHPDRHPQASESERYSTEEAMKNANRAYEVLGNQARRKRYDEDRLRNNRPPKPVVEPAVIVFRDAEPGQRYTGSFVIRNYGGAYETISIDDPGPWVQITGYASLGQDDELPLRVEITASGYGFGRSYTQSISVGLDGVETAVSVQLRTKPAPAQGYARSTQATAQATVQPAGIPGWAKGLGIAAAVAVVVMMIGTSISDQTGSPANNGRPAVNQTWSNGSNYLGSPQRSTGSQQWTQGTQSGYPGVMPVYPNARPGDPGYGMPENQSGGAGSLSGYQGNQIGRIGSMPLYSGAQPGVPASGRNSSGFRPSTSGFRSNSSGSGPSSSGFQPSFYSFGR